MATKFPQPDVGKPEVYKMESFIPLIEMESTSDDFEEEEEVIVYANFEEGTIDREIFQNSDLKFKVIGLDSDTPVVQLGDQTFKGTWNDTIGTRVFFEEDPTPEQVDPVFTVLPQKMLKYKCMSTKTLDLSRIFLKLKNTDQPKDGDENNSSMNGSVTESQEEILNLAQSTVNPDSSTSEVMNNIVIETIMDITE